VEAGLIICIPPIFHASNFNIHNTLFAVQASLVSIVLAIVAIVMALGDSKIHGYSVREFVSEIRPLLLFKFRIVFVVAIILTGLSFVSLALELNDISIGFFFATLLLLGYFVYENIKTMMSPNLVESYIEEYILDLKSFDPKIIAFEGILENIKENNAVLFEKSFDFIKNKLIDKIYIDSIVNKENIEKFQNCIRYIIEKTKNADNRFIEKVFELCIIAFEKANKETEQGNKIILENLINYSAMYDMVSKLNFSELEGKNNKLLRICKALLEQTATNELIESQSNDVKRWGYISLLATYIKKNNYLLKKECEISYSILLKSVSSGYFGYNDEPATVQRYKENEKIDLVIKLFEFGAYEIIDAFFGVRKPSPFWESFPNIAYRTYYDFTRENLYYILYLYYIGYREASINEDEREHYKILLNEVLYKSTARFWPNKLVRQRDTLVEYCRIFSILLEKHARWKEDGRGLRSRNGSTVEITKDFFLFLTLSATKNINELEKILPIILKTASRGDRFYDPSEDASFSYLSDFQRYVSRDDGLTASKRYTELIVDILDIQNVNNSDFDVLKTAITNLYRSEKQVEAVEANNGFVRLQNKYQNCIQEAIEEKLNDFTKEFASFDDNDTIIFEKCYLASMYDTTSHLSYNPDESMKSSASMLAGVAIENLCDYIYTISKDHICLFNTEGKYGVPTVKLFLDQVKGIEANIVMGRELFRLDDPDYDKIKFLMETSIPVYFANFLVAFDSRLIKINVQNIETMIRELTTDEINLKISEGKGMTVNKYKLSVDDSVHFTYLKNYMRRIEVQCEVAIHFIDEKVGGGFMYVGDNT